MKAKATTGMVRTALFLKPEQTSQLQVLSDLTGAPMAELIRRAIDAYLESRRAEIRGGK
jgi:predicted DNA-binding protein